jgi:hypothetical protein
MENARQDPIMTVPVDIHKKSVGYVYNAALSTAGRQQIARLQQKLIRTFPDAFWAAPPESLHITLLDLLTPVTTYDDDPDILYKELKDDYTQALITALQDQTAITVSFDQVKLFPAALIVEGHDNGSFKRLRDNFIKQVTLLPGTKLPPTIIHSTIGKFLKSLPLDVVSAALSGEQLVFKEVIREFRLVRETRVFMLEHQILEQFPLEKPQA